TQGIDSGSCTAARPATSVTATNPLQKSRKKTPNPNLRPSTRPTLVAPILPLPCSRISIPFHFPTNSPNGTEPSTYAPITSQIGFITSSSIPKINRPQLRVHQFAGKGVADRPCQPPSLQP